MTDVLQETTSDDLVPGTAAEAELEAAQAETVPRALLRRIRAGRNKDFDRLVFDLDGPVPGVRVQHVHELRHEGPGT